jgi:hypothetical protein
MRREALFKYLTLIYLVASPQELNTRQTVITRDIANFAKLLNEMN